MQTGHVFKKHDSLFVIFFLCAPYVMVRFIDVDTVDEACEALGKEFAGHFKPAKDHHKTAANSRMRRLDTLVLT